MLLHPACGTGMIQALSFQITQSKMPREKYSAFDLQYWLELPSKIGRAFGMFSIPDCLDIQELNSTEELRQHPKPHVVHGNPLRKR
jgi:hypothetical protein